MADGRRPALGRRLWCNIMAALAATAFGLTSTGCTSTVPGPLTASPGAATPVDTASATELPTISALSTPPPVIAGGSFTNSQLSFRFDRSWSPSTWEVVSTASTSVVYLSSQPTHNPCVTSHLAHGITEIACSSPVTSLTPGGVLISWYYFGMPGTALHYASGRAITIAGQPARLSSGSADPGCARLGGTRSIDATIEPAGRLDSSLLHMDACLTVADQTTSVLAMLRSLRFTPPAAATPSARFPPVADDDPCRPLHHDPDLRQPAGSGPLPWTSVVTAARWCVGSPGPRGERFARYQSSGRLSVLTRALHASLTATGHVTVSCPAGPPSLPVAVEVLDQYGNLFRPTLPVDSCGAISGTLTALNETAPKSMSSK